MKRLSQMRSLRFPNDYNTSKALTVTSTTKIMAVISYCNSFNNPSLKCAESTQALPERQICLLALRQKLHMTRETVVSGLC